MKSLKKVFFSRFWKKKGKIAYLDNEELNELIRLLEKGKFDKVLILNQQINRRRNLDFDGSAITFAFQKYLLFLKGELQEGDMILFADELNKREKQVKTLRGKIIVKLIHTMICIYISFEEKHIKTLNELLEKTEKSQNVIDSYLRDWIKVNLNYSLGLMYLSNGEYDSTLNYLSETSKINEKHNWKRIQVSVLGSTGTSYALQDELDLAIARYQEALKLAEEIGNVRGIYINECNLIDCYIDKSDFQKALKLAKSSYKRSQETEIPNYIGSSLAYIIYALVELGLDEQIQPYLDELEELIINFPQNNLLIYAYQCAKGIILKSSKNFSDRIKARELFTQMLDVPGGVIDPKIGFFVAELTLQELQTTNNEELLVEFEQKVESLKEKALQFRSTSMLVDTYLLESKLALIKTNLKEAQQKLDQALKLAREKNLRRLLFKVSKAYDKFLDEKKTWESLRDAPFKERLDNAQLDTLIDQAIHRRLEKIEEIPEESIYLFILSDGGLTVYSYDFVEEKVIDEQLVGGFLSAINTFCQEMFSAKGGYLERVKYQDYTILLEPLESFIVSYVIKGDSYLASKRLIKLTDEIKASPLYADFEEIKNSGLVTLDYDTMKDMIIEIF